VVSTAAAKSADLPPAEEVVEWARKKREKLGTA
jgi:hypothetical protein